MTMRELARLANVSVSTVSKAFGEAKDISDETKKYIFELARQNGCYGKFYKGKYPKKIIALIFPELYSNYYAEYLEKLQGILEQNNCIVLISAYHFDNELQAELMEYYCSYLQVDGIIVTSLGKPLKKGYNTPVVSLFSTKDTAVDTVEVDITTPIYEAIERLRVLGHKKVAFIGEELTVSKGTVFCNAARELGMECISYCSKLRFEKAGEEGIQNLFSQKNDITAVFCAYDNIAFGAIKQLKREGLRVPEDVSVIGMDNINLSEYTETSLTTIDSDTNAVCETAWNIMKNKLKNRFYCSDKQHIIQGKLIFRETLGAVKDVKKP